MKKLGIRNFLIKKEIPSNEKRIKKVKDKLRIKSKK